MFVRHLDYFSEHRETLALEKWDSRAPSDFPFIIYLSILRFKAEALTAFAIYLYN